MMRKCQKSLKKNQDLKSKVISATLGDIKKHVTKFAKTLTVIV